MNIEYAAGLIDGEGWIGITSRSRGETYEINLKVSMSDKGRPALEALAGLFGGRVAADAAATEIRRSTLRWQLTGKAAAAALRRLEPHLLIKAVPCQIALELAEMVEAAPIGRGGGRKWNAEMSERAAMLRSRIKEANRRGPDPNPPTLPGERPVAIYSHGWWWEPDDDLFGPVEFQGQLPVCGRMVAGHVYATPSWSERQESSLTPTPLLQTPVASEGSKPSNTMGVARRSATGQVFLTNQIVTLCGLDPSET